MFVFAVTQLSHSLIEHFTRLGGVQTLLLMLAVWWVWIYTSWATNWLDPEKVAAWSSLLVLMLLGLILSSSIPQAFESRGLAFAGAYTAMQVGRTLFFLWYWLVNARTAGPKSSNVNSTGFSAERSLPGIVVMPQ